MADESTIYRRTLHQIYETCCPDELVQGWTTQDMITLANAGTQKRGLVLMTGTGGFIPATSEGIGSANEVCILASTREVPEGMTATSLGYFSGTFNADSLIFSWETKSDNHSAIVEQVRGALRQHNILVK